VTNGEQGLTVLYRTYVIYNFFPTNPPGSDEPPRDLWRLYPLATASAAGAPAMRVEKWLAYVVVLPVLLLSLRTLPSDSPNASVEVHITVP
jgi:hypothetical protein